MLITTIHSTSFYEAEIVCADSSIFKQSCTRLLQIHQSSELSSILYLFLKLQTRCSSKFYKLLWRNGLQAQMIRAFSNRVQQELGYPWQNPLLEKQLSIYLSIYLDCCCYLGDEMYELLKGCLGWIEGELYHTAPNLPWKFAHCCFCTCNLLETANYNISKKKLAWEINYNVLFSKLSQNQTQCPFTVGSYSSSHIDLLPRSCLQHSPNTLDTIMRKYKISYIKLVLLAGYLWDYFEH